MSYLLEADLVADVVRAAAAMNVYVEFCGQRKAKGSGSTRGLPDAFLYAGGKCLPLELKRPASDGTRAGRFSLDQLVAAQRRREQSVETYAIDSLEAFVCCVNWARYGNGPICRSCPTVPGP